MDENPQAYKCLPIVTANQWGWQVLCPVDIRATWDGSPDPSGLTVDVDADVDGPGHIALFGEETGGIDLQKSAVVVTPGAPRLSIDAHLGVGEIEVSHR